MMEMRSSLNFPILFSMALRCILDVLLDVCGLLETAFETEVASQLLMLVSREWLKPWKH